MLNASNYILNYTFMFNAKMLKLLTQLLTTIVLLWFLSPMRLLLVMGQQIGTSIPEVHPKLTWQQCQKDGHCTTVEGAVVMEANGRPVHDSHGKNCRNGDQWDKAICLDALTCAKNCALEGVNYTSRGVTANGGALRQHYITGSTAGFRTLMMANESHYQMFNLLGAEFTFDVDVSTLPCGTNGAIFFVNMESDGGAAKRPTDKAGVRYGTGYCDAQCPKSNRFWGCCAEMDLWEANSMATQFTAHPCSSTMSCDGEGCGYNSYRMGNHSFYGPGQIVDTKKVITVVTQFITSDGTAHGDLTEIRRFYVQDGHVIPNSVLKIADVSVNSMSQEFCDHMQKAFKGTDAFTINGGMKKMGEALKSGMVLAFQLWDDIYTRMWWLDSNIPFSPATEPGVVRGPCPVTDGIPSETHAKHPNAYIVFSNIKIGPVNSTFHHA